MVYDSFDSRIYCLLFQDITIDYGMRDQNPMDKVYFYKKATPAQAAVYKDDVRMNCYLYNHSKPKFLL